MTRMNSQAQHPTRLCLGVLLALVVGLSLITAAHAQSISLSSHVATAGGLARVPVLVSNVPSLAAASLTVNYDPQVLTLANVQAGTLGAFTVESQDAGGSVRLAAVQTDALTNASGTVAVLEFLVKPGAMVGTASPLTIADRSLSGAVGKLLEWSAAITHTDGSVTVVSASLDSDGDTLPDWWEDLHFGSADFTTGPEDSDHDGISNYAEYLAGTDPLIGEPLFRVSGGGRTAQGLLLSFATVAGRTYHVQESADLLRWTSRPENVIGDGNAAQFTVPFAADGSPRFYRLVTP